MMVFLKGLDLATSPTCISRLVFLYFQRGATDLILCCRFWQTSQDIALTTVVTSLLGGKRSVEDFNENYASHLDITIHSFISYIKAFTSHLREAKNKSNIINFATGDPEGLPVAQSGWFESF